MKKIRETKGEMKLKEPRRKGRKGEQRPTMKQRIRDTKRTKHKNTDANTGRNRERKK
jgi:hypothetical protein